MNASHCISIVAFATTAALAGTALGNGTELEKKSDPPSAVTNNSAAQLGPAGTAAPRRSGDSKRPRGTDNPAAQLGAGVNANAAAQLNNETQATSTPSADSNSNDTAAKATK